MSYTASYIVNDSSAQGTTDFQFTFPYIQEDHIEVYVNYNKITRGSGSNQYQVITNVSPKLIRLNTGIASANLRVEVLRNSSLGTPIVDYADGSTLTANDLDTSALQSLYIDQELKDSQNRTVTVDEATGLPTLNDQRLTDVADPVAAQDAATKNYVDTNDALKVAKAGDTMSGALAMGTNKVTGVGDPTAAQDAATKNYVDTNDNLQLSRGGGTMTGDIATGGNRITGLPNPASGSEPVTKTYFEAQSWDNTTETIASDETWAGNNTKIATTGAIDGRIDSKIDTAIEGDVLAGTDLTKTQTGGQVTINHSVTGATSVDNSNGNVIQDLTINPRGHVTAIGSTDLDTRYYLKTQVDAGQLDNRYFTETELLGGSLDSRYYTEAEADARFYNLDSGEEIQSGETWSAADNKIATTAAIDARIVDLVEEVGGFVPIANETSFPTANPDINNGTGTLVSVQVLASSHTPSGGTVTIANGAGSGNTVTITGCGSTSLPAGFGVIVSTTSTLHTYAFHRLTPKATEVTTVAGNNSNITTVATNIANINTVASDLNESTSEIDTVANAIANVNTVGNAIANVNTAATNIANINTVASDLNESTSEIDTVATNIANVNTVGTSIANVNTVANDLNETTSEIDTVATNIANVNTVGNAITNVNNVGGSITNVNTVATNLADVSNYADRYQIASSDPSTRADSSSLQEGDQYFNTSADVLKVYDGSNWNTGVTDTTGFAVSTGQTFTGNVGVPAGTNGAPGLFIAGDTDTGVYSPGANTLAMSVSGTNVFQVGSSGTTTNGTSTATSFSGSGASLTSLNASNLASGTVPTARLGSGTASSSNFLRGDGSWQTVDTSTVTVTNSTAAATTYPLFAGNGSTSSGVLNALSNTSFTFNASTGELGTKRLTLTHGSSGSDTPLEINGSSAGGQKIKLSGSGAPYIQFQENTTDKAYIRWDNTPGSGYEYFLIHNQQSNRIFAIDTEFKVSYNDGSNWHTVWNANNDGSGSGLDADTLDGVQGASFLRSDADDTMSQHLTFTDSDAYPVDINSTNDAKIVLRGSSNPYIRFREGNTDKAYIIWSDAGHLDIYNQEQSASLRIKDTLDFTTDGGNYHSVVHAGNVGSGGALSGSSVYVNDLYAGNWFRNSSNGHGLYNSANNNHFYSDSANFWTVAYNGTNGGIRIRDGHAGTARGFFYADDSNNVGILTNDENWAIKVASTKAAYFVGGAYPESNNSANLGSNGTKWNQVHATTFHGDGSNLTGISSAPEYALTASGTISQGKPCIVNSSGQAVQVTETLTHENPHTEIAWKQLQSSWDPKEWRGVWEPVSGRMMFGGFIQFYSSKLLMVGAYMRDKDGIPWEANEWQFGNYFPFGQYGVYLNRAHHSAPCHNDNGTMFMAAMDVTSNGNARDLKAVAWTCTPTEKGGNNTLGTPATSSLEHKHDEDNIDACYIGNNKFFVLHGSETYGTGHTGTNPWRYQPKCSIVTLSGTGNRTCTWSSPSATFCTTGTKTNQSIVYDEASGKVVIAYIDAYNNNNSLKVCTAAVDSSNNISFSSGQEVHNDADNDTGRMSLAYDKNIQKTILAYLTDDRHARCRVIDVSNSANSFSLGTDTSIEAAAAHSKSRMAVGYDPKFQKTVAFWQCNDNDTSAVVLTMNTSNNNVSVSSKHQVHGDYDQTDFPGNAANHPDFGEFWLGTSPGNFQVLVASLGTATTNLTSDNFIGFAKGSASNGGSVTVQLTGSVQENQSGLTAGKKYYVRGDGSLKTSSDTLHDISTVAGRAISSTKLVIKDQ